MLDFIRNMNFGWILIFLGFLMIISGFSMIDDETREKTFLCFDRGCIYVQGVSCIVFGIFTIIISIYQMLRYRIMK